MRDQARCSVNMMTGVEVATPQLLRVLGGRERKGRCLKNGGEKNYTSSLSVCTAVRLYYALSRRAFSWPVTVLSRKLNSVSMCIASNSAGYLRLCLFGVRRTGHEADQSQKSVTINHLALELDIYSLAHNLCNM